MNITIPSHIQKVIDILKSNGYDGYLVGGCVRDAAMGKEPHDFDITTNALPDEIISCFAGFRIIETGLKHGTVTVVSDGENVEITTYRIDGAYLDNRRPETVTFTSLVDEDLSRRDFTVNAMAYNPYDGFVDLFGGLEDLEQKIIRCVGNPDKRFGEDGLRIMRAMRFASVLDFKIDTETEASIHQNKHLMQNISAERIYTELKKLICGVGAADILNGYYDVMCVIFPELSDKADKYSTAVSCLPLVQSDYVSRFSCLLSDFEQSDVKSFMRRLKPDNDSLKNVVLLTSYCKKTLCCDEISIRRLMSELSEENIYRLAGLKKVLDLSFEYGRFMQSYQDVKSKNPCVSLKQLAVNGADLMALGINQGPDIGKYMNAVLNAVIENRCKNNKYDIIEFIKNNRQCDL